MSGKDEWIWPARPTNEAEYSAMMVDLDRHLATQRLQPAQRSLNAARLVSIALKLSGTPILSADPDRGEPFGPRDLLARVADWCDATYGDRNKIDFALGYVVLPLRGTYWSLRIPLVFGTVFPFADRDLSNTGRQLTTRATGPATHNVLSGLKGVTQNYASQLTDIEVASVLRSYQRGYVALTALDELKGHELFSAARGDYGFSVEALLDGRALGKARWDNAQCAEKVLKGLLGRAGQPFPTNAAQGHDIVHLGRLVSQHFSLALPESDLRLIYCPPKVRYAQVAIDQEEAWVAHEALLGVLGHLRSIALPPGGKRLRA
ncbi:hypothetical protein [Arenimonas caeni]|uniref:Uncharacterized protein n=1 Tax=Arenimonas caeni TaxID=2058085 RepID=A0A2P6M5K5_9GAMM|nr:hypothetical protein [Arenimonas caeni]PRH81266.1 hypothetical protein C6N40_13525 [Arenimonas caeni]